MQQQSPKQQPLRDTYPFKSTIQASVTDEQITEYSHKQIVLVQKNIRACFDRIKIKNRLKKLTKRRRIIQQLIESEQNYIRDLGFIVSDFNMKLLSNKLLNQQQSRIIFSNVQQIRKLHQDFFITLYNNFVNYTHYYVIFADILKIILFFRIYIEYLNNFPTACEMVDNLQKINPDFAEFLIEISRSKKYRFLRIQDYLIKPVQRLPKYVLLLKQIKKNTQADHPDYRNICKALQKFEQVNSNNNDKLLKISNNYKLLEIGEALKLPDGIITPTVQFILQQAVQIYVPEYNTVYPNCMLYLLNNAAIVSRKSRLLRFRETACTQNKVTAFNERLQAIVPIKHGTSLIKSKDQDIYKYSLTIQAPDGQSCTFICSSSQQFTVLHNRLQKQISAIEYETINKLQVMLKTENNSHIHHQSFLLNLSLVDLIPEVTILGTAERRDKMLKYTIYIIEIKVKMVRQKIFLRFSELLEIQQQISILYPSIVMKQNLRINSWLKNHQQKTIQQRKINIERFLKQLLSKPQVICNGSKILIKLGLPVDFYDLPKKLMNSRNGEQYLKKNSLASITHFNDLLTRKKNTNKNISKSIVKTNNSRLKGVQFPSFIKSLKKSSEIQAPCSLYNNKIVNHKSTIKGSCRMSIFQQQKIEQEKQQKILEQQEQYQQRQSSVSSEDQSSEQLKQQEISQNLYKSSNAKKFHEKLTIQDILKANQIDLGHYTRMSQFSTNYDAKQFITSGKNKRSTSQIFRKNQTVMKQVNTDINITVYIMAIENNYHKNINKKQHQNVQKQNQKFKIIQQKGYLPIHLCITKYQRIQSIIPQIAKSLKLKCYKDFRLFAEKQFSHRVLDDDELVYKIVQEIQRNNSILIFKKYIYLDNETQQKEMKNDRVRLSLIAAQTINQVKKGRYFLSYQQYLKFSVLTGIIYGEHHGKTEQLLKTNTQSLIQEQPLARTSFPYLHKHSSLNHTKQMYSLHNNLKYLRSIASESIQMIFPKYCSFSHKINVWIEDYIRTYRIILAKLFYIRDRNSQHQTICLENIFDSEMGCKNSVLIKNNKSILITEKNPNIRVSKQVESFISEGDYQKIVEQTANNQSIGHNKPKTQVSIKYLAMLGIIKEIELCENDLFGGNTFSVQISQALKQYLHKNSMIKNRFSSKNQQDQRMTYRDRLNQSQRNWKSMLKQGQQTRNCWLVVRYNKLLLLSIDLRIVLLQIPYKKLKTIQTYSTSLVIVLKRSRKQGDRIDDIKLKTTASYYIRDLITYYRNYNQVKKKLIISQDLRDSVSELARQQIVQVRMGQIQEVIL